MKTWAVWFAEYPDEGSIHVEAETRKEALVIGARNLDAGDAEVNCALIPEPDYAALVDPHPPAPTEVEDRSQEIADVVRANREAQLGKGEGDGS